MTEKEISTKLVIDITRIMAAAEVPPANTSWLKAAEKVRQDLNAGEEQKLIDMINKILENHAAHETIGGVLRKTFLINTRTLLKNRITSDTKPTQVGANFHAAGNITLEDAREILKNLKQYGSTVIGYAAFEACDCNPELLEAALSDALTRECHDGDPKLIRVTVEVEKREPESFPEKSSYMGHRSWVHTPVMPMILVKMI